MDMFNHNIFIWSETILIGLVNWIFKLLIVVWCVYRWKFICMLVPCPFLVKNLTNIFCLFVETIDSILILIYCSSGTAFNDNFWVFYLLISINLCSLRLLVWIWSLNGEKFVYFICDKLSHKKEREPNQMNINCENWGLHYAWTWT